MERVAKFILVSGPPILGATLMAFATTDFTEASSTVSKNLALLGVDAPPRWLLAKATDGWLMGIAASVLIAWVETIVWATRSKDTDRDFYKSQLQTIYGNVGQGLALALGIQTDEQLALLVAETESVLNKAVQWIEKNMGNAAVVKFGEAHGASHSYEWPGVHSAKARSERDDLIDGLKDRQLNLNELMSSGQWDHAVPLRKREAAEKRTAMKNLVWSKAPLRWFASIAS